MIPHFCAPRRVFAEKIHKQVPMRSRSVPVLSLSLLLGGCGPTEAPAPVTNPAPLVAPVPPPAAAPAIPRLSDPAVLAHGQRVYKTYCAGCHGAHAEGAPDWYRRGPDGRWPPPPLDGTGHAWHHTFDWLKRTIEEGTLHSGGGMPGWKNTLSDRDIETVIAWFQSLWPEEIYASWARMELEARRRNASP